MFILGIVTTVLGTTLHLLVRAAHVDVPYLAGVLKMTASTGFLVAALAAGAFRSRTGVVLFLGLVFGWFGDLFLIGSGASYFMAGLVSFFAGHLCYAASFAMRKVQWAFVALALAALIFPGYRLAQWLLPGVKDHALRAPVIAYMCVITIMLALAAGCLARPAGVSLFVGAVLFYLSDIFVARAAFVAPGFINSVIGLPLYFGGQLLLAVSIFYANKSATDTA